MLTAPTTLNPSANAPVAGAQPDNTIYSGDRSQILLRRTLLGVLDTLIQEKAAVPLSSIQAIVDAFPTQALILIARLPIAESRPTLSRWI